MDVGGPILQLIQQWGYPLVFLGAVLEGETVLLLAGLLAHSGHLQFPLVVAAAAAGGFAGDQLFFLLGRRHGGRLLARFPRLNGAAMRADGMLARHHVLFILANRFLYGLRIAGPLAVGMSAVPAGRFALLNLIGAVIWGLAITGAGYFFGQAMELLLGDIRRMEEWLLGAIVVAVLLVHAFSRLRKP